MITQNYKFKLLIKETDSLIFIIWHKFKAKNWIIAHSSVSANIILEFHVKYWPNVLNMYFNTNFYSFQPLQLLFQVNFLGPNTTFSQPKLQILCFFSTSTQNFCKCLIRFSRNNNIQLLQTNRSFYPIIIGKNRTIITKGRGENLLS